MYSYWYFWFHKQDPRLEDQQGWNLGFVWCLLVIHKCAFGQNNRDPGQQSLFEQLVQYNAQSCPYQNGSCRSPKRSHQRPTVSVWRSSLQTNRWHCYGVPSQAPINKRLHVSIEDTLEQQGKLPSFYYRYVDDTLTVMPDLATATTFLHNLNSAPLRSNSSWRWNRTTSFLSLALNY